MKVWMLHRQLINWETADTENDWWLYKKEEGARQEGEWVNAYLRDGWIILNRKKTGGIGTIAFGKWNRATCYEEAKRFKTRKEFRIKSSSAYKSAWKHGWLDDYTWFINGRKKENWFMWERAS